MRSCGAMKRLKVGNPTVFLGILSVVAGITIYLGTGPAISIKNLMWTKILPRPAPSPAARPTHAAKQPPTAINIPKIGKNLPIRPAHVVGNTWDLYDDAVAWLSTSATPGEGNVILYAHDWQSLWGDLYLLNVGDTIEVQQNNVWKEYVVSESRAVAPNDTQSILSEADQLTMYTCEGNFDQKRRVVYAKPVD